MVARAGGDPDVLSTLYVVPHYRERAAPVLTKSDGATFIAAGLGGAWRMAAWLRFIPRGLRDRGYDLVARHRHRAPSSGESCLVPSPDQRRRFVEHEPS